MTPFENLLETILVEYASRDSKGEFDTWKKTDAFIKEKAEVLLAYVKEEPVSNITGIKSRKAEGKLKECIESITEESLSNARKQLEESTSDASFIEIPFGTDSELIEETICIPNNCYAIIDGNKVVIRKGEEPVRKIDFEKALEDFNEHHVDDNGFFNPLDLAKYFYDEGYFNGHIHDGDRIEHVDGRRVNVSRLQRVAKPIEESTSEELDVIAREYAGIPCDAPKDLTYCVHDKKAKYDAVLFGANWKEQQFEKNRIKHCGSITKEQAELEQGFVDQHLDKYQRMPTFLDAIEYGKDLQKQQMMKEAIDGEVGYWNLHGLSVNVELPSTIEEGDKVKVILIKGEEI